MGQDWWRSTVFNVFRPATFLFGPSPRTSPIMQVCIGSNLPLADRDLSGVNGVAVQLTFAQGHHRDCLGITEDKDGHGSLAVNEDGSSISTFRRTSEADAVRSVKYVLMWGLRHLSQPLQADVKPGSHPLPAYVMIMCTACSPLLRVP